MPPETETGTLRIFSDRGGTVAEVSGFLADLGAAYVSMYRFRYSWERHPLARRRHLLLLLESGLPYPFVELPGMPGASPESVLPEYRLSIKRISIESPGFWEFLASLNPLQQIREYLNDRHKRRQDKDFREAPERERLILENELIQRQIWEKDNSVSRERIEIMRELGFSDDEIRQLVWASIGNPLARLGRHQDSRLIGSAE